jgi:hypothetical protein
LNKISKKSIDELCDRLALFERRHPEIIDPNHLKETDYQKEIRFAELREKRRKDKEAYEAAIESEEWQAELKRNGFTDLTTANGDEVLALLGEWNERKRLKKIQENKHYAPADNPTAEEIKFYKRKLKEGRKAKFYLQSTVDAINRWLYDEAMKREQAAKKKEKKSRR